MTDYHVQDHHHGEVRLFGHDRYDRPFDIVIDPLDALTVGEQVQEQASRALATVHTDRRGRVTAARTEPVS